MVLKHLHDVDEEVKAAIAMEGEFYENVDELREWQMWKGNYNQKKMKQELQELFEEELLRDGSLSTISVPKISQETKHEWLDKMKKEQDIRFAIHRMEWDCAFNKLLFDDKETYKKAKRIRCHPNTNPAWKWFSSLFTMKFPARPTAPAYRTSYEHQKWVLKYGKDQKAKKLQSKTFGYQYAQMKCRQYLLKGAFEKHLVKKLSATKLDNLGMEKRIVYNIGFGKRCLETSKTVLSWDYTQRAYRDSASKLFFQRQQEAKKEKKTNKKKGKKKKSKKGKKSKK